MRVAESRRVDEFIDSLPVSRFQKRIVAICFLILMIEGFDTSSVGFIAPAIRAQWKLSPEAMAPLFALGLTGLMIGAVLFGPVADRVGRKKVLAISVLVFGACSLASAAATDITTLVVLRFATGLGLGGAMPNAITLTSEYCPARVRSTLVTMMFCGFTIGAMIGGFISTRIVDLGGWQAILIIGGIAPLLVVPLIVAALPESLRFLVLRNDGRHDTRVAAIASRIADSAGIPALVAEEAAVRSSVRSLFSRDVVSGTIALWVSFFASVAVIYLLMNWLPLMLTEAGVPLAQASLIATMYQVGATVGAVLLGRCMDRLGAGRVLGYSYAGAAFCILLCAMALESKLFLSLAVLATGFFLSGSLICGYALSASYYPTSMRATGVAWANAVGRLGSILGSIVGGTIMQSHVGLKGAILLLAIPVIAAALSMVAIGRASPSRVATGASAKQSVVSE